MPTSTTVAPAIQQKFNALERIIGHTPLLASLQIGVLWYRKGQEKTYLALAWGVPNRLVGRARAVPPITKPTSDTKATVVAHSRRGVAP